MPRIDPIQLLKCLSVLLSPNGGIKSNDEVHRLASLMTKFSKKLVSKCIYIQILKCTETELLGSFMGSGGWRLVHMWLTESIVAKNWPLVRELLELLLLCPVDIDRLKTNNCPKLVKELSKDGSQAAIRALAAKLVEQWLKTVKGEPVIPVSESDFPQIISETIDLARAESGVPDVILESTSVNQENLVDSKDDSKSQSVSEMDEALVTEVTEIPPSTKEQNLNEENIKDVQALPILLKISLKDGKQVVSKLDEAEQNKKTESTSTEKVKDLKSNKTKNKSDDGKSTSSRSSSKHSSSSRSHSSKSSSSDKHRSSSKSSSSSSSSSNRDKSRDRSKESSRHSSSSDKHKKSNDKSHSSSSHKSKTDKTKTDKSHKSDKSKDEKSHRSSKEQRNSSDKDQIDKNKDILEKLQPPPISKLMKIPKVSEALRRDTPSISIETRKPNDPNRPKTVKMFNSKFRSHGLEEDAKPPPPRVAVVKKPPPVLPPTVSMPKRQSPSHDIEAPPEKKSKIIELSEKPGSIKLIPAKPKHNWGSSNIKKSLEDKLV